MSQKCPLGFLYNLEQLEPIFVILAYSFLIFLAYKLVLLIACRSSSPHLDSRGFELHHWHSARESLVSTERSPSFQLPTNFFPCIAYINHCTYDNNNNNNKWCTRQSAYWLRDGWCRKIVAIIGLQTPGNTLVMGRVLEFQVGIGFAVYTGRFLNKNKRIL